MNKKSYSPGNMVSTKNKVLSCSTPERRPESPSSDSLCDSDAASPVPFLCTQDGAEGETDVVWNFYTPKADSAPPSRLRNSTPINKRVKKAIRPKLIEKPLQKRKTCLKNKELFADLIELNQNLHELIARKSKKEVVIESQQSGSEEDIFSNSGDSSPKSGLKTNSRCLRRNLLSSKFSKPETENVFESDDSMNECLIKASQVVEEKILKHEPTPAKRKCHDQSIAKFKNAPNLLEMDNHSMDAILNSIKLDSPILSRSKKCESPRLNNDSFENFVGNLNDSALERLTQKPISENFDSKLTFQNSIRTADWSVKEMTMHVGSPLSKSYMGRHNSMPESPTVNNMNKPSTSGMAFGRYSSMPDKNDGDSPNKCTPDEIKRKHQLAREKLLAKRLLPFTSTQQPSQPVSQVSQQTKNTKFKPRSPSNRHQFKPVTLDAPKESTAVDLKAVIEKKRQEALMKLRRRQPASKFM